MPFCLCNRLILNKIYKYFKLFRIFVTDKGEILTTGDNRYGKLGLNQKLFSSIQFLPILVEKYQNLDVKLVRK